MSEYSYTDIIINPTQKGIERLIGKEVYYHNYPGMCLDCANKELIVNFGILTEIRKDNIFPFIINQNGLICKTSCIIEKKEYAKYVPFKSADEFFDAYDSAKYSLKKGTVENKLLRYGGMWLMYNSNTLHMVDKIFEDGVFMEIDRMKTKWEELLKKYTFLDGTPCGKKRS